MRVITRVRLPAGKYILSLCSLFFFHNLKVIPITNVQPWQHPASNRFPWRCQIKLQVSKKTPTFYKLRKSRKIFSTNLTWSISNVLHNFPWVIADILSNINFTNKLLFLVLTIKFSPSVFRKCVYTLKATFYLPFHQWMSRTVVIFSRFSRIW
jgi:hypothetical protein